MEQKVGAITQANLLGLGSAASIMGLAQASGFGVYLISTTVVGAMTHAIGITLPFVFYTTLSSTISILIGPVGWAGLAVGVLSLIAKEDLKKTVPAVMIIACSRARLQLQWEKQVQALESERRAVEWSKCDLTRRKKELLAALERYACS